MGLELAIFWGFVSGLPLVAGAIVTRFFTFNKKTIGIIMAFGSGVMISVISFSLMKEAYELGGIIPISVGFTVGAIIFGIGNREIHKRGARHRKRPFHPETKNMKATGLVLALGSLMDNIPESIALGISLVGASSVTSALLAGIILTNFPEAVASSQAMKVVKRNPKYILSTWGSIAAANIAAAAAGFLFFGQIGPEGVAIALSLAAGAILAMLAETMMPEAYELGGFHISLATAAGFLVAFVIGLQSMT
jgi:ZIP family zinc transporter